MRLHIQIIWFDEWYGTYVYDPYEVPLPYTYTNYSVGEMAQVYRERRF